MGGGTYLNNANFVQALVALQVEEEVVTVHLFGGGTLLLEGAEGEKLLTDLGLRQSRVEVPRMVLPNGPIRLT